MKTIRAGSGLGDSFYLRSVAQEFLHRGEQVIVRSNYPDAFLGLSVKVEPFNRGGVDIVCHYTTRKQVRGTNQFADMGIVAGLGPDVHLDIEWTVRNKTLVDGLIASAAARPIIVVHGGRAPMERSDGFGAELLPKREAFDAALSAFSDCFLVRIGKAPQTYPLRCDVDLNGSTSVTDLFDIAMVAHAFVAQVSFCVPLAEMFGKPLLAVWAAHGMQSNMHYYISSITPEKVFSKPTSKFVVDDWPVEKIQEAARAFRQF